jgi:hypothetical protein
MEAPLPELVWLKRVYQLLRLNFTAARNGLREPVSTQNHVV